MIALTSYNRMLRYLSAVAGTPLTSSAAQKQMITGWINAASRQIEKVLGRELQYDSYIEYFDTKTDRDTIFTVKAYPITAITDVYIDGSSLWDGSESEITDCFTGKNSDTIILPSSPSIFGFKTIRVRYTGGMAVYGVRSVVTLTGSSGTWSVNQFVLGSSSEAVGIIKSIVTDQLTIEILYGVFEEGETLTEYTDEDCTTVGDASATLDSFTSQSLVEQYPDIVRAAEIQIRYYWKHKDDFEITSTQKDATNQRTINDKRYLLTSEAYNLLIPYMFKPM